MLALNTNTTCVIVGGSEIVSHLIIFRMLRNFHDPQEFHIEGRQAKILGWGGTIDKANATVQGMKVQCDLLEAHTMVKQCIM